MKRSINTLYDNLFDRTYADQLIRKLFNDPGYILQIPFDLPLFKYLYDNNIKLAQIRPIAHREIYFNIIKQDPNIYYNSIERIKCNGKAIHHAYLHGLELKFLQSKYQKFISFNTIYHIINHNPEKLKFIYDYDISYIIEIATKYPDLIDIIKQNLHYKSFAYIIERGKEHIFPYTKYHTVYNALMYLYNTVYSQPCVLIILKNNFRHIQLLQLAKYKLPNMYIKKCLEDNPDLIKFIPKYRRSATYWRIALSKKPELVEYLLQSGADINRISEQWEGIHVYIPPIHVPVLITFSLDNCKTIL